MTVSIALLLGGLARALGPIAVFCMVLGLLGAAVILARPLLGLMVVYASFPVGFHELPPGLQVVEIVVLLVTGLVVLHRLLQGRTPLPWAPEMWWALFVVGAAVLATPSAVSLDHAVRQDVLLVGGFTFGLAVLGACQSLDDVRRLIAALLLLGLGICAAGWIQTSSIEADFGGAVVQDRAQGIFAQPNDFGNFSATILILAIGMSLAARSRAARLFAALVIPVSAIALALSLSRGSWIGTALGIVLLLLILPAARRSAVRVGIPALVIIVVAINLMPSSGPFEIVGQRVHTILHPTSNPYDTRPMVYREAFREINADPLTGQGPASFAASSSRAGSLTQHAGAIHAHNVLLTVAVEIGLPAAFMVVGMTIALGLLMIRAVRRLPDLRDRALVAGIGAALFVQVGQGITDFNLRNPVLFILIWSLAGMLLVARLELREPESEGTSALKRYLPTWAAPWMSA